MAISKILCIGGCGAGYPGKHLRQALDYIAEPGKTGNGKWVSALNCQGDDVYGQMHRTKADFGKTDKRQGYHLIISFEEGETDAETAFEVVGKFAEEYLGKEYEALYAVHDNTAHIHGHIIFNSVSFRDGKKYRYEKGDWAKKIQPVTNRLCEEYGLSTIEISEERASQSRRYREWADQKNGKSVWADMIKRDIDACIIQSPTYEAFLSMLSEMGYGIKNAGRDGGKHLAVRPMGMTRFRRCKSLGEDYTEEMIRERIRTEDLSAYRPAFKRAPKIMHCRVKRYRKAGMSGIQKRYFARLYRTGLLKKRPYSQAWKYRDDIRKMQELQEDYLFLGRHKISTVKEIADLAESVKGKKKKLSGEKSRIFKERARMKPLFDMAEEMQELQECENCYQRGEELFEKEHLRWQALAEMLKKEGYSQESLGDLKEYYRGKAALVREREKSAAKEIRIAERILGELRSRNPRKDKQQEEMRDKGDLIPRTRR